MIRNYLLIAWRNILKSPVYSFINIAGLSLGLAAAMLIILYVKDELSYDRFHEQLPHIYRVVSRTDGDGPSSKNSNTGFFQGPKFTAGIPEFRSFTRIADSYGTVKKATEVESQEFYYVDTSFFSIFSFPLLAGNPKTALQQPRGMVISEDFARRQFGTANALGKTISFRTDSVFEPWTVTGVAARCPQNSTIKFDVLLPFNEPKSEESNKENWFNIFLNTFVTIAPGSSIPRVEAKMKKLYEEDAKEAIISIREKYGVKSTTTYLLQPMADIHLNKELGANNGLRDGSNPVYSYILSGIALFILVIACINFVNLTVARSLKRAKEIGIRKVVGGGRTQLIRQFLGESFLVTLFAFLLAILLVELALPLFNNLSNKKLAISYLMDSRLVFGYSVLFLITGLLAGFYPALVLSRFNPVQTLYNRFQMQGKNYLQKSLVILQFSLASFLIMATFTIYRQFHFLLHADLGYDDKNLVLVEKPGLTPREADLFRAELLKNPDIIQMAGKNSGYWATVAKVNGDSMIDFAYEIVDENYLPLLKIPLISGRVFSKEFPADSGQSVLVNESFVRKAGWKNPLGQTVNFWYQNNKKYTVIGVVRDHHFESLNAPIHPQLFIMKSGENFGLAAIKIKPGSEAAVLPFISRTFRSLFPLSPYSYKFKEQENRENYASEEKWKQIMLFGAILTIFISSIGLFGLSVLAAERRTKEIGIRKVLGASVALIVRILSLDFIKLIVLSLLIAVPAAWYAGQSWLNNYPYRITLSGWIYGLAGMMVVLLALFTISFQAIRAAMNSPVKSLRTE